MRRTGDAPGLNRILLGVSHLMIAGATMGLLLLGAVLIKAAHDGAEPLTQAVVDQDDVLEAAVDGSITRLQVPRIGLDAEVVQSKFINTDGGTWEIPAHKVGHAEFTAGAGSAGNAVLLGHITSVTLGRVFQDLPKVRVGDEVQVLSPAGSYTYDVVDVRVVSRFDVSIMAPTVEPTVSLITCVGRWLPLEQDYEDRLLVRGELRRT